jgi:hypothetical protein
MMPSVGGRLLLQQGDMLLDRGGRDEAGAAAMNRAQPSAPQFLVEHAPAQRQQRHRFGHPVQLTGCGLRVDHPAFLVVELRTGKVRPCHPRRRRR